MANKDVRDSALCVLHGFEKDGKWSDLALKSEIKKQDFDRRDAALLSEIVYGTIQNKMLCDYYIEYFAGRRTNKISPAVLDILRISLYQIIFLDRVPASAAVNCGVELAKRRLGKNRAAAGFVNAVLRRAAREADDLPPVKAADDDRKLSIEYSHPLWFVREMRRALDEQGVRQLLEANNSRPPVTIRVNTLKNDAQTLARMLADKGIECTAGFEPECMILSRAGDISELEQFKNGLFYIQDAASQYAVRALAPQPGEFVTDMCAAPGGKSLLAAQLMNNRGRINAYDLYEHKAELIRKNARKYGADIIWACARDSLEFDPKAERTADRVICDVPCSGTGVIRKKPEIRYKNREDIEKLTEIQQKM